MMPFEAWTASRRGIRLPLVYVIRNEVVFGRAVRVCLQSSLRDRRAVGRIARYFTEETGAGSVWASDGREHDRTSTAYLVLPAGCDARPCVVQAHAIGAAVFRNDVDRGRVLDGVWLHPAHRRQGILTGLWPHLRETEGAFAISPPVSPAMRAFLEKLGGKA
jgi:hypothetical protein